MHDVGSPTLDGATRRGRLMMLVILLVCAAPVVASYITYFFIRPGGHTTNYGTLIQPSRSLPVDLPLRALDGRPVPARSLRGQWLLVAIGPSSCIGACERRLYMQRQLREMLGADSDRMDKVWFVTDERPLPDALRRAVDAEAGLTVLRVERAALAAWLEPASGHALEDHLYLVDPMGEWMMRLPAQPDPQQVKRDLSLLMRASASWDTPGR